MSQSNIPESNMPEQVKNDSKKDPSPQFEFQKKYSFEKRAAQCEKLRTQFPTYRPMIVEPVNTKTTRRIDKSKFLVPEHHTLAQFLMVLKEKVTLLKDQGLFLFTADNTIPPATELISRLYEQKKDQDGYLYLHYATENTFGRGHAKGTCCCEA